MRSLVCLALAGLLAPMANAQPADVVAFTGQAEAMQVQLRVRVSGRLEKIHFKAGTDVKKGDLLFELEPRPYEVELHVAQAELSLREARLKLEEADHRRATKLLEARGISQEEFERQLAGLQVAKAEVELARAKIERAKLDLEYTRIVAPIDGKIGHANIPVGNFIETGRPDGDFLTTITSLDPIHVLVQVDDKSQFRFRRLYEESTKAAKPLTIEVGLVGSDGYPHRAIIDFVDHQVDPATASLKVRAILPNSKGEILPGQVVRVKVSLGERK